MIMDWKEKDSALEKSFDFEDFIQAFAFLTQVAILSEKQNHHPEIWNVYNKVRLRLSTHDDGDKITDKDRHLSRAIDRLQG